MFADHRGARPQVVNTVARGQLHEDSYFYTGVVQGANGYREEQNLMPFPVTLEVLKRGQERFNIYCTPCHSRVGNGLGEIVRARLQAGRQSARPGAAGAAGLALLLRDDAWLRRHARLLGATDAGGSLGGGGLHSRVAVEPGGDGEGCAGGRAGEEPEGHCRRRSTCRRDLPSRGRCRRRRFRPIRRSPRRERRRMAPANPADPAIKIPVSKPAAQ